MKRFLFLSAAIAVGLLLTAGAVSALAGDLGKLPPAADKVEKTLREKPISITKAIEIAAKETGGVVEAASFYEKKDRSGYEVTVVAGGKRWNVRIDAGSGEVLKKTEVPRFPGVATVGEMKISNTGLMWYDIKEGVGPSPSSSSATVVVHYSGWTLDGSMFDSSVERGEPATFPLNRVIKGWTEGLQSMNVGGKRKLIIPSKLGYGDRGAAGGKIPGGAMLVFDVELIDIKK